MQTASNNFPGKATPTQMRIAHRWQVPFRRTLGALALVLAIPMTSALAQSPLTISVPAHYGYGTKATVAAMTSTTAVSPRSAVDPTDPVIVAKAAALGNDPAQIFAFVRDHIAIDLYRGSLRGGHATLSSAAGSPLDRASLTIALLRASGFGARYAQGSLSFDDAQRIVARSFTDPQRLVGCNNPSPISNGRNDYGLITDTQVHSWVEYQPVAAGAWVALDPAFADAMVGQSFATATATFDTLPANQQHRVRVRVIAEMWSQASAIYGFGLDTATVLDRSFDSVDLVDHPITIGHFVARSAAPSLTYSALTNTYSPYLMVGDSTLDPRDYVAQRGTDYGETLTNFPLGVTLVTGVFVQIDVISPTDSFNPQTYQRVLYDRIGYALRQTGGTVNADPTGAAVVSPLDLLTVQVSPAWQPLDAFAARKTRLDGLQGELAAISASVLALPPADQQTPDQVALRVRASDLNRYTSTAVLELMTAAFEGAASRNAKDMAANYLVKSWIGSPRLTIAQSRVSGDAFNLGLDIRKNDLRVYPQPRISWNNVGNYERARGLAESVLEGEIFNGVTGLPTRSFASLIAASPTPDLVAITRQDVGKVETLALSADARARIRDTVSAPGGRSVIAPRVPVSIGGTPYTIWLENDPVSGATISTGEDGTHQAISEYGGLLLELLGVSNYQTIMAKFIGQVNSIGVVGVAFTAALLDAAVSGNEFTNPIAHMKAILNGPTGPLALIIKDLKDTGASEFCQGGCGLVQSLLSGLLEGIQTFLAALNAGDPPVPTIVMSPPLPPLPAPVAPSPTPGVTLDVVRDERYFVPFYGAELPTVYLAKITNTGPATDTFLIQNYGTNWGGYSSYVAGADQITLAAGASGEVGICIKPQEALQPVGTPRDLGIQVTSTTTPSVTVISQQPIATPPASALLMRISPTSATMQAGTTTTATLTLDSFGNQPTQTNLTANLPAGLSLAGLPSSASLATGQSQSLPLSFTVASGIASGTALAALVQGDFGGVDKAEARFTANVSSPLTQCVARAAVDATRFGRQGMAATLVRLASAMDVLAGMPADATARAAVLLELGNLISNQLPNSIFSTFVAPLNAAATSLTNANASQVPGVLGTINATLCGLGDVLADAASANFPIGLNPAVSINLPSQSASVNVNVQNATTIPRAFDIAVSGVPATVSAVLNTGSVSVPAGETTNRCPGCAPALTIAFSNNDGLARSFDYTVTVTPHDNPALAKTIVGTFVLRNDIVRIASVTPTPRAVDAGTPVQLTVRVMNAINAPRTVHAGLRLYDSTGTYRGTGSTDSVTLAPGDAVVALPDFTIATTGLAGSYRVDVLLYENCCDPIPNSAGSTSFLVGQPLSAALSVTPSAVAPGSSALDYTLTLSHESAPQPVIDLRSSLSMPASTRSFAQLGQYLYVCQRDRVQIVDTTNPDALAVVATFATDLLGTGYGVVGCNLDGNTLVLAWNFANESSFDDLKLVAFDLAGAHATAPQQLNATPVSVPKRFGGRMSFNASHQASLTTTAVLFNPFSNFIFAQYGNLLRLDFANPATPSLVGELYHHVDAGDSYDPIYGGPNVVGGSLALGNTTLVASTTATGDGFGTGPGVGRLLGIDTTLLSGNCPGMPNPCIASTRDVAEARVLLDIAGQGNAALIVGDTLGSYDGRSGSTGYVTVSALDVTAPAAPIVRSTLVSAMLNRSPGNAPCASQPFSTGGSSLQALSNNVYAYGVFNPLSCAWALALIDANDPLHLRVIPYDVPTVLRQTLLAGSRLYALTDTAILVYDYASIAGPAITAHVDIPKGTGVSINPASFSTAPTGVDSSAPAFDRYTFYRPTAANITWQGSVSGMTPGTIRTVANGGDVQFTVPTLGSGTLLLDAVNVTSAQSLSITPARQSVTVGAPATYTVTLTNPTTSVVNYTLAVQGVPPDWIQSFDNQVGVPANGQAAATLVLQTGLGDTPYLETPFTVTGASNTGYSTSVQAVLVTSGVNIGGDYTGAVYGATLTALDTPVAIGRGSIAPVTLRARNIGTAAQAFTFYNSAADPGFFVQFLRNGFTAAPRTDSDVVVNISVPSDATPGPHPVGVLLASYGAQVSTTFAVNVLAQGVRVQVTPAIGTPSTTFNALITNTGTSTDTFDVSALGQLGPAVGLTPTVVTLAAGASQSIALSLGDTTWLPPTTAAFDVQAISRGNPIARARGSAQVGIPAQRHLTLYGVPPTIVAPNLPAARSFGVQVANTGNVEDVYALSIAATTGTISATLRKPDGSATSTLTPVRIPGRGAAQVTVDAVLSGGNSGTVTVLAVSSSDPAITATTLLTIQRTGDANLVLGTPGALEFGDQIVSTTSTPRSIALTNSGSADFTISSISVTGAQAGDFSAATGSNACMVGTTLAAGGGGCTLYATFAPTALGSRSATLSVVGTNAGSISAALHGNGIAAPDRLTITMTPLRNFAQYGRVVNYLVTVRNPAAIAISGASISSVLPAELDSAASSWICINAGDAGVSCTASGVGPLVDSNVLVPAQGSINYLLSAPVQAIAPTDQVTTSASVLTPGFPTPNTASVTVQLVIYRDGFEPYGGGTGGVINGAVLDASQSLHLAVADQSDGIADLLRLRGNDGSEIHVETANVGEHRFVRLLVRDDGIAHAASERSSTWLAVAAGTQVQLALVDGNPRLVLLDAAGQWRHLEVGGCCTTYLVVGGAVPAADP